MRCQSIVLVCLSLLASGFAAPAPIADNFLPTTAEAENPSPARPTAPSAMLLQSPGKPEKLVQYYDNDEVNSIARKSTNTRDGAGASTNADGSTTYDGSGYTDLTVDQIDANIATGVKTLFATPLECCHKAACCKAHSEALPSDHGLYEQPSHTDTTTEPAWTSDGTSAGTECDPNEVNMKIGKKATPSSCFVSNCMDMCGHLNCNCNVGCTGPQCSGGQPEPGDMTKAAGSSYFKKVEPATKSNTNDYKSAQEEPESDKNEINDNSDFYPYNGETEGMAKMSRKGRDSTGENEYTDMQDHFKGKVEDAGAGYHWTNPASGQTAQDTPPVL